jgi:hypothetical protein
MRHAPPPPAPAGGGSRGLRSRELGQARRRRALPGITPLDAGASWDATCPHPHPPPLGAGVAAQDGLRGRELGQARRRRVLPGVTPLNAGASWDATRPHPHPPRWGQESPRRMACVVASWDKRAGGACSQVLPR